MLNIINKITKKTCGTEMRSRESVAENYRTKVNSLEIFFFEKWMLYIKYLYVSFMI